MMNELTRINSHLVWLGTHALDMGAMTVFLYCFREREDILRLFEAVSGQRMMTSYSAWEGALEPRWISSTECASSPIVSVESGRIEGLLTGNPIWMMEPRAWRNFLRRCLAIQRQRSDSARQRRGL